MECKLEIVEQDLNIPGRILLQDKPGWRCRSSLHWHSELEFVYMIHGCMEARVNGQEYRIHDGEFYFVDHEEIHINAAPDKTAVQKYLVVLLSYEELKKYCENLEQYVIHVNGNEKVRGEIDGLLKQLVQYEESEPPYSQVLVNQVILQLYYIFLTKCLKPRVYFPREKGDVRYAKQIIRYIQTHFREKSTMNMLADEVGLSPHYMSKYFKAVTNMNLSKYLGRVRVENANRELVSGDRTVTEVALDNGFANVKSYINTCKHVYGMTPAEYKKKQGKQSSIALISTKSNTELPDPRKSPSIS